MKLYHEAFLRGKAQAYDNLITAFTIQGAAVLTGAQIAAILQEQRDKLK